MRGARAVWTASSSRRRVESKRGTGRFASPIAKRPVFAWERQRTAPDRIGLVAGELIDIATARRLVLDAVEPLPPERVALEESLGRVLAEDVDSPGDVPPFDSSALDGYVVGDTGGGELPVVGESRAGTPTGRPVGAGEAMRISTGAAVPSG